MISYDSNATQQYYLKTTTSIHGACGLASIAVQLFCLQMQIVRGSHAVWWDVLAFRTTEDPVRAKEILNEILNREDLQNPSAFVMKAMLTRHFRNMPREVQSLAFFPMCFFLHILAFVSLATFIVKWCSCKCSKICPKGRPLSTSPHSDIEWTQSLRASKSSHCYWWYM